MSILVAFSCFCKFSLRDSILNRVTFQTMKKDDVFDLHDCIVLKVVTGYSCNSSIFKDNFELFVFLLFLCEPIAVLNEGSIPISRFF